MTEKIRKSDSLFNDLVNVKQLLKEVQLEYSREIGELALITKRNLYTHLTSLTKDPSSKTAIQPKLEHDFEELEDKLYNVQELQAKIDDIISQMDGWEINDRAHVKILDILRAQENQQVELRKDLDSLKKDVIVSDELNSEGAKDVYDSLEDYMINFSRLQDYVAESIPQVEKLFDELDSSLARTKQYSEKGLI